jgi:hypothetical protein
MVVFTTINPNGNFEAQNEAMSSWASKFSVYSVNTKNDIDKVKDLYPYVNFIETEDTYIYKEKELIKLNALLEAIKSSDKEYACIVNSDIILNSSIDISDLLKNKYLDKGLIISTRYELDGEKEPYPFTSGYDIFIFNKKNVNLFSNKNYVIGMPWWDYWIPIISNKNSFTIYHINSKLIYHKTHQTNYDGDVWNEFGQSLYKDIVSKKGFWSTADGKVVSDIKNHADIYSFCTSIKKFIEKEQININLSEKKEKLNMKIVFFTTSTFSDIQETQSECINKLFPKSDHIKIDGRTGWFTVWYEWLNRSYKYVADWYVHIDEDCFITSRDEIENLIQYMIKNNLDIAGPPDGYFEYRGGNNMAFNSFFMIMNRKCIDAWFNRKSIPQFKQEWIEEYPYEKKGGVNYEYNMEFGSSGKPIGLIWKPCTEPYYDFMWVLKESGIKFHYLEPIFGHEFQTTNLLNNTIYHMWHQRERWSNNIVSTAHTMPNKQRFDGMITKIKQIL